MTAISLVGVALAWFLRDHVLEEAMGRTPKTTVTTTAPAATPATPPRTTARSAPTAQLTSDASEGGGS
jgi:hypothetical protein